MNKAIFLDKDWTLVDNSTYPEVPKNDILPWVIEWLKDLKNTWFLLFIISNQSFINKWQATEEQINKDFEALLNKFETWWVKIDWYYYCPHRWDENCECRKPKTTLVDRLVKEYDIDINQSWVIWDSIQDQELAKNLWCKLIIVKNENTTNLPNSWDYSYIFVENMIEASQIVK